MNLWITDPKNKEKSVSLTILVAAVVINISAIFLEGYGQIESASAAETFFMSAAALYFGRKFTTNKGAVVEPEQK